MQALLDVILPVFLVIGFGYVAAWKGWLSEAAIDGITRFTQNFAIPCLIYRAISEIDFGANFHWSLLVSYYTGSLVSFAAGIAGARWFFKRNAVDSVAIGFCCLYANSLLLGLPITERAYGTDALASNYAIVALHAPICYFVGVTAMEIARNRAATFAQTVPLVLSAMFRNALVIGIALGVVVNLSGITPPAVFTDAVDLMVSAALPAAIFGLGGILVRYRPEGDIKTVLMVCAITLIFYPAVVWCMGTILGLDRDGFRSAVMTAAMAPGVNVFLFANMYGAARRVAASSVLIGTALSIFTLWVWLIILP